MNNFNKGPFPPNSFSYDGRCVVCKQRRVWKMLSFLWSKPNRRAHVDLLAEPIWEDKNHDISYMAIASLRRAANKFFRENGLPFMVRTKDQVVYIIEQDSTSIKVQKDGS